MANLLYRSSSTPTTPVSTTVKNSPLTNLEVDGNFKSINDDLTLKAPLNSPTLTGTPTAPTADPYTSTTQIATTKFVVDQITLAGTTSGAAAGAFFENNIVLAESYTITAGKNAGTFGPVTVNPGVVITVPTGSVWTVV